jgi:hypothetical protein
MVPYCDSKQRQQLYLHKGHIVHLDDKEIFQFFVFRYP